MHVIIFYVTVFFTYFLIFAYIIWPTSILSWAELASSRGLQLVKNERENSDRTGQIEVIKKWEEIGDVVDDP